MFGIKTKSGKFKPGTIFLFTFLVILLPGFLIWLLVGEVDLLNMDLIVSHNGAFWKGNVHGRQDIIDWIINTYNPDHPPVITDTFVYISNTGEPIIKNLVFLFSLIPLMFAIVIPLIMIIFNSYNIMIFPSSIATSLGFFIFIFSGLMPIETGAPKYFLQLIILFISIVVLFFGINKITNAILSTTSVGVRMAIELQSDKRIMNKYEKDLKDIVNNRSTKDNIDYIEIDK